jgi:tRNA1(Val) A37 N6-methylase TrmN6
MVKLSWAQWARAIVRKMDQAETTEDRLLGGRLLLRQPAKGYRAGMDAALLAAAVEASPGMRVLEAGCGAGAALLQAAWRNPGAAFTGIERDPAALALAEANGVRVLAGDVDAGFKALELEPFDAAFSNPPFFDDAGALRGPHPSKAGAWMADGGLGAWTRFLLDGIKRGGAVTVIHRADRLGDLLALLADGGGSLQVRPIHPHADEPAKRVLVRARKGGRAPFVILPPLVLHDRSGAKHTAEADAILRGEASISWA